MQQNKAMVFHREQVIIQGEMAFDGILPCWRLKEEWKAMHKEQLSIESKSYD